MESLALRKSRTWSAIILATLCIAQVSPTVLGQVAPQAEAGKEQAGKEQAGKEEGLGAFGGQGEVNVPSFREAMQAFSDPEQYLDLVVGMVLAALLALIIAYHPKSFGKASRLDELEQPKTFIIYAVVAALVAKIVGQFNAFALVIFGIGGLLRFRTDVGAAKDTGRVILVTVIGLACGVNMLLQAIFGCVFGWLLIYFMESRVAHRIMIKGLDKENLSAAALAYQEVLRSQGCSIVGEKKSFVKGHAAVVFRAPSRVSREELESLFETQVPENLRGAVDWETT